MSGIAPDALFFMASMKKTVANKKKIFIIEHMCEMSGERTTMGVVMKEQDKRAIESMCRCGLDIEGRCYFCFSNVSQRERYGNL